jgi:hypothetical protein
MAVRNVGRTADADLCVRYPYAVKVSDCSARTVVLLVVRFPIGDLIMLMLLVAVTFGGALMVMQNF